jgi:hypothetical protein
MFTDATHDSQLIAAHDCHFARTNTALFPENEPMANNIDVT